jgi:hypothetical protein
LIECPVVLYGSQRRTGKQRAVRKEDNRGHTLSVWTSPGILTSTEDPTNVIAIPDPDSIRGYANSSLDSRNLFSKMRADDARR